MLAACPAAAASIWMVSPCISCSGAHNREPCFFDEQDYHVYLQWLGEALAREHCALHAYVLMTNHVHLLVTPESAASIPRVIIAVGRRYVQYINHSYRRTGTLWDSRYKSSLVQAEI